jgi:hypothetical protein
VLVGGLAVGAHGYVRGTRDVDFVVNMKLREAQRRLRDDHIPSTLARVALLEGDITWLRGTVGEVPFDILPAIVPIDWDASIAVPLGRATLRVVDLEGLLRLKVRAGGPRDLMDVAALVVRHPQRRERA